MTRLLTLLITTLLFTAPLAADHLLQVHIESLQRSEDGNTASSLVVLRNKAGADITDIEVDLILSSGGKPVTLTAANHPAWGQLWTCQSTNSQSVRCRLPFFRGGETPGFWPFIPLVATFHPANEGRFSLRANAKGTIGDATFTSTSSVEAVFAREVVVTNTRDAGEGSLRAALEYANDICARDKVPCTLKFRFAEGTPEQGWPTIRPLTPLPAITAPDLEIGVDAEKHLELDGSLLTAGHGLEVRGEGRIAIDGLTIGGFPGDGIAITRRGSTAIRRCNIGVLPGGEPNPNRSRGVTINPPASGVSLWANRIAANVRSGVFIAGGERISLESNVIGVHTLPWYFDPRLSNGASGVFVGPAARDVRIAVNYIGGNAQMGIAVARGARGVSVENTWIDSESGQRIDHGLDGFSGYARQPSDFALPAPRLESMTYDEAAQTVTLRGTFDAPDPSRPWKLTLYGTGFGNWPESSLPQFEFTGTAFAVTFFWPESSAFFRATVGSVDPSDWSTSEFSEPITLTATP